MVLCNWVLPILIGFVASILLLSILMNNPRVKQTFSDLGALIQLQTSRPVYYPAYFAVQTNGGYVSKEDSTKIGGGVSDFVYNYFPMTPTLDQAKYTSEELKKMQNIKTNNDTVFKNKPDEGLRSDLVAYYGGYPYMLPAMVYPVTNMDNVKGIEESIRF